MLVPSQVECCSGNGLVYTDNPLSKLACPWGALPPTCPVMPRKWQQRLMCATDGVFILPAGVCEGPSSPEPFFASRSVRRAHLTPQAHPGSLYRCSKST